MTLTVFQSIILGIVQGITEFLPISSSGHLVLTPFLLGWEIPDEHVFVFDVLVQVATLGAVFAYFRQDLALIIRATIASLLDAKLLGTVEARLGWYLILATIPASIIGLTIRGTIEATFKSPYATSLFLLVTAVMLLIGERAGKRNREMESLTWIDALMMGLYQTLALFPGISRSGATITGGMVRNLERQTAARFSFLMSVPVMLAAGAIATVDLLKIPNLITLLPTFVPGFLASAIVGYFSIRWLLGFLIRHPLYIFAIYCLSLGLISLILSQSVRLAPLTATEPPTLQPVEIALTPSLAPLKDALHTCAVEQPEIALILSETSAPFLEIEEADLSLWFGPPPPAAGYAAPLAQEEIAVIVNALNPVSALSTDTLRAIFTGRTPRWDAVGGENQDIQVWLLPEGDEFTRVFQQQVLNAQYFSSTALLAPDPAAMLEAVHEDPAAIGFLPEAWLENAVKPLRLERQARNSLDQPVLALSSAEPRGAVRIFLHCLQSGEGQATIREDYQSWRASSQR